MAKKAPRKRMNRKMKRAIRKSISAMFMATALLVAAIPVENVSATEGEPVLDGDPGNNVAVEEISYDDLNIQIDSTLGYPREVRDRGFGSDVSDDRFDYTMDAKTIADYGGGLYIIENLYKVAKFGNRYGIVGYNLDVRNRDNSTTLKIPSKLAKDYASFRLSNVVADTDVNNGVYNVKTVTPEEGNPYEEYSNLKRMCVSYGFLSQGEADRMSFKVGEIAEGDVQRYALDVYACKMANSSGYIARKVLENSTQTSSDLFVPYNEATNSYATTEEYPIFIIGDDAFSRNTYSGSNPDLGGQSPTNITRIEFEGTINGIGDNAFAGMTSLREIDLTGVANIGNRAFLDCNGLQNAKLYNNPEDSAGLNIIGAEAFKGCTSLQTLDMPYTVSEIQGGAFANCINLRQVDMEDVSTDNVIGNGAFYNCPGLQEFLFSPSTMNIGMGAFAVPASSSNDMLKDVVFSNANNINYKVSFRPQDKSVFEGRKNMETFIFPETFGKDSTTYIPDHFFRGCSSLKKVVIPGPYVILGENTFGVISDEFYVEGPATSDGTDDINYANKECFSDTRRTAHDAGVTYKFTARGVPYFDIAYRYGENDEFTDYYLINANTGALEKYMPDPSATSNEIVIKGDYNGVSVTSISEGCFDEVKNSASKLIVEDNTVSGIGDSAFKDFTALQEVYLGNSVSSIGKNAFAGCELLHDVTFDMDKVTIGADAFKTDGDDGLVFHGKIDKNFEPFKYAMDRNNDINGEGLRILYKSFEPSNLAVIYDNIASTEDKAVATLISYPISTCDDTREMVNNNALYDDEGVRKIVIPAGVTSIDTSLFYTNEGRNTEAQNVYVSGNAGKSIHAVWQASTNTNLLGSATRTVSENTTPSPIVAGMFSGGYVDGVPCADEKGNDYIYSVEMSTVEKLPAFAFDSCENLNSVMLGDGLTDIGIAPFRGCTSLASVGGNSKFICENSIIYEVKDDGTYALVECLAGRALNTVSNETDPKLDNVSEVRESAFEDCPNIAIVDLHTAKKLTTIQKNAFKNCAMMSKVVLPETVNEIFAGAFANIPGNVDITIPAKEVYINSTAFDGSPRVTITTYEDTAAWRFGKDNGITLLELNEDYCTVKFLNWDFSELFSTSIKNPGYVKYEGKTPTRDGYTFTGWRCLTSGITYSGQITESCIFVAMFEPNGGTSGGNSGGNGGSSTNGNNNGSTNGNGSNSDNKDDDEKLYTVTVVNGSGSGSYVKDANVIITANNPEKGKKFKEWVVDTKNVSLASTRVTATTFKMPDADVKVTAVYEDDKSSSSTNKNSVSGNSSSSSSNRNNSTNGTKVIITRPGISDTDLAAAKVNGSKDSYIVKISETAEATAAVEAALINKYGSLDNIRYCAMDISLYDSTGTNKITDTTGYTIDITIPLPDSLREYAGNNKTAAVVNSQLEALSPKFSTIDGVPCVTFRATHFSPYTVYVDTQNLTAGGLDSTPKTGDGIHPKWFLSMGLACLSVILFMKKDKKSPKVKVA